MTLRVDQIISAAVQRPRSSFHTSLMKVQLDMAGDALGGTSAQYQFISLPWGCKYPAKIIWQSNAADDFPVMAERDTGGDIRSWLATIAAMAAR